MGIVMPVVTLLRETHSDSAHQRITDSTTVSDTVKVDTLIVSSSLRRQHCDEMSDLLIFTFFMLCRYVEHAFG